MGEPYLTFSYELDEFQKEGFKHIHEGKSVMCSVPTSSGKTTLAKYGIMKAMKEGKRVVYTSPIKTLSNQKYAEIKEMFVSLRTENEYSIGILTGDIKLNPDAQCIVMTTEVCMNMLHKYKANPETTRLIDSIGCVIFDEVHYINDKSRGKVWETSLALMPQHIQLIMLSATIYDPEEFTNVKLKQLTHRNIELVTTTKRIIPLTHFGFAYDELFHIMDNSNKFDEKEYDRFVKEYEYFIKNKSESPSYMINSLIDYLLRHELLPVLFFIFSRNKCEQYSYMIQKTLTTHQESAQIEHEFDSYIVQNKDRYKESEQVDAVKGLLMKGIAVHHSGLIPILKEIVEILFSKGLIKILFATETFALGVNMPTKTVVFTELEKYDQSNRRRLLTTDEYKQMSGRAGRRGFDTSGTSIYLPLRNVLDKQSVKSVMTSPIAPITSKFSIGYQLVLRLIQNENHNIYDILESTISHVEKEMLIKRNMEEIELYKKMLDSWVDLSNTYNIEDRLQTYISLKNELKDGISQSRRKKVSIRLHKMEMEIDKLQLCYDNLQHKKSYEQKIKELDESVSYLKIMDKITVRQIIGFLIELGYIELIDKDDINNLTKENLTVKGVLASEINECNEILFTEILTSGLLDGLTDVEIVSILSIFINDNKANDDFSIDHICLDDKLKSKLRSIENMRNKYKDMEDLFHIEENTNWELDYSFADAIYQWASGKTLTETYEYTSIYEGNFIRNVAKVNHMCEELIKLCELCKKHEIIKVLKGINEKLMRDIVTMDSLYVR